MSEPEPELTTATLDRIVDGRTAVLLLEDDGEVVDELPVDVDALPEAGRRDGAVFDLVVADGDLREVTYLEAETERRLESAGEWFDRLSERLDDGSEG